MTNEEKKARVFEALDWLRNDPENLSAYAARLILNLLDIPHTVDELNEWAATDPMENVKRQLFVEALANRAVNQSAGQLFSPDILAKAG